MKLRLKIPVLPAAVLFSSLLLRFYSFPPDCAASAMSGICSGVMSVLGDEKEKAAAAAKSCKKNCRWTDHKHEILETVHKKAKESCARGEVPDVKEADKALGGDAKARLKSLYDRNNRLFDGKAKLSDKNFEPIPSRQAAVLTGNGGGVADLKSSEPDIRKIGRATEFSLGGTKLPGESAGRSSIKESSALLASAQPVKISTATTASPPKTSTDTASGSAGSPAAYAKTSVPAAKAALAASAGDIDPGFAGCFCLGTNPDYVILKGPIAPNEAACPSACCKVYGLLCKPDDGHDCAPDKIWSSATGGCVCWAGYITDEDGNCIPAGADNLMLTIRKLAAKLGISVYAFFTNWYLPMNEWISDLINKLRREQCEEGGKDCCGAFAFDPGEQCCTESQDVVPLKMKHLSDCEARYQIQDVPFENKGCSVPTGLELILKGFYGIKDRNEPIPGVSFLGSCFNHDTCYRKCNSGETSDKMKKKGCDDAFKIQMTKECNTSDLDDYALTWCRDLAGVYYDGVNKKGMGDYRDSQLKNCSCCPQ